MSEITKDSPSKLSKLREKFKGVRTQHDIVAAGSCPVDYMRPLENSVDVKPTEAVSQHYSADHYRPLVEPDIAAPSYSANLPDYMRPVVHPPPSQISANTLLEPESYPAPTQQLVPDHNILLVPPAPLSYPQAVVSDHKRALVPPPPPPPPLPGQQTPDHMRSLILTPPEILTDTPKKPATTSVLYPTPVSGQQAPNYMLPLRPSVPGRQAPSHMLTLIPSPQEILDTPMDPSSDSEQEADHMRTLELPHPPPPMNYLRPVVPEYSQEGKVQELLVSPAPLDKLRKKQNQRQHMVTIDLDRPIESSDLEDRKSSQAPDPHFVVNDYYDIKSSNQKEKYSSKAPDPHFVISNNDEIEFPNVEDKYSSQTPEPHFVLNNHDGTHFPKIRARDLQDFGSNSNAYNGKKRWYLAQSEDEIIGKCSSSAGAPICLIDMAVIEDGWYSMGKSVKTVAGHEEIRMISRDYPSRLRLYRQLELKTGGWIELEINLGLFDNSDCILHYVEFNHGLPETDGRTNPLLYAWII
ncbi:hypothetical protein BGZ76_007052 [Entomortierella beljakovae]|nr:hypothetical protein BGZ76_007052 [Entomortierella beljakovae]